ncbi:MAG: 30S ribosomal protein S12 methylthiotransferase RimO [Clostridia bacterium]|nr:30S ribosomal protein S12 methylthiotransferase RimO [Clostridia bacterium]
MTKQQLTTKLVSAVSLGCDKNKVDLEKMLGRLKEYGFTIIEEAENADIVIINTCAFIQPAQEEAIENILQFEHLKKIGKVEKVIVTGCFPERNYEEVKANFPEIDAFLRLRENDNICGVIEKLYQIEQSKPAKKFSRVLTNSPSYAYLKIADGCDNVCSYCTIPRIRGRYKSTPIEQLTAEAKDLASKGVKEIILVAQDTTKYGEDIYGENALIKLCDNLSKIKEIKWIRLHYAYPERIDDKLLAYISKNEKMCKYLDVPLQHIDDKILKSMRRRVDENGTRELIEKIRGDYPQIALRSTFIVGYPSESGKDFKKLCNFIKQTKFDYAGFFPYSKEPNTASFYMKGQVKNFIKNSRTRKIRKIQNSIVIEKAKALIGQEMEVLVDFFDQTTGEYCGHSQNLSPTVDFGVRFVDNNSVKVADFVKVKIYDFDGSDYKGEIV